MRPPESITVIGFEVTIAREASKDFNDSRWGEYDSERRHIRLNGDIGGDLERETLLHEVVHAVSLAMDAELNERQVKVMARGLYSTLKDNPALARFLLLESEQTHRRAA